MDDQTRALLTGVILSIGLQAFKGIVPKLKKLPAWSMRLINVGLAVGAQAGLAFAEGTAMDWTRMLVAMATTYAGAEGTYQLGLKAVGDAANKLCKKG